MPETKPLYFKEFEDIVLKRFDGIDKKFEGLEVKIEKKIEDEISGLAAITLRGFEEMHKKFDTLEMEPRLKRLEKAVFDS